MPRICLFGCRTAGLKLHTFPNPNKDLKMFQTWITILKTYVKTPDDYDFYKKKRVCDKHFSEEYKLRHNRISVDAVPTLYLEGNFPGMENTAACASPQNRSPSSTSAVVDIDHDYYLPATKEEVSHHSALQKKISSDDINELETSRRIIKDLRSEVSRLRKIVKSYEKRFLLLEKMNNKALTRVTRNTYIIT